MDYDYEYEEEYEDETDELYLPEEVLHEDFHLIIEKIERTVSTWAGFAAYEDFKCLTPEYLTYLAKYVENIQSSIQYFFARCEANELEPLIIEMYRNEMQSRQFELDVLDTISESYHLSVNETMVYIPKHYADLSEKMLIRHVVTPWVCPPVPELVIPERPSVVLKVIGLQSPFCVSVGFDDIFIPDVLAESVPCDEELQIGDRIILKIDEWPGFGHQLVAPEYYGLAEPTCPCETPDTLEEVRYGFDVKSETERHAESHKLNWEMEHFIYEPYDKFAQVGKGLWTSEKRPIASVKMSMLDVYGMDGYKTKFDDCYKAAESELSALADEGHLAIEKAQKLLKMFKAASKHY